MRDTHLPPIAAGEVIERRRENAPGHAKNRMTTEQVAEKFRSVLGSRRDASVAEAALDFWLGLPEAGSILPGIALLDRS